MAIRIPILNINDQQKFLINRDLTIIKKPKFFGRKFIKSNDPPIFQYKLTQDHLKAEYYIYLPFYYGCCLYNNFLNYNNQYLISNTKFTKSLYEGQKVVADKAIDFLNQRCSIILDLFTGFGKTVVGAYLSHKIGLKTLIVIANTILIDQWDFTYKDFTDAKIWIVGDKQPEDFDIIICMVERIEHISKEILYQIGVLIIDEAHSFCTPTRTQALLEIFPKYVIAMSATVDRDDGMSKIMENVCGLERIIEKSVKPFIVYKFNTGIEFITPVNNNGMSNWTKHVDMIYSNELRNDLIIKMCTESFKDDKILILSWRVEHVQNLYNLLIQNGENCDYIAGDKKSYHDSRILIGSISKISQGFDERTACPDFSGVRLNVLILTGSMKSTLMLTQIFGRVFRCEFPKIVYMVDENDLVKKHWKVCEKWCSVRNSNIINWNSPYAVVEQNPEDIAFNQYKKYLQDKIKK